MQTVACLSISSIRTFFLIPVKCLELAQLLWRGKPGEAQGWWWWAAIVLVFTCATRGWAPATQRPLYSTSPFPSVYHCHTCTHKRNVGVENAHINVRTHITTHPAGCSLWVWGEKRKEREQSRERESDRDEKGEKRETSVLIIITTTVHIEPRLGWATTAPL